MRRNFRSKSHKLVAFPAKRMDHAFEIAVELKRFEVKIRKAATAMVAVASMLVVGIALPTSIAQASSPAYLFTVQSVAGSIVPGRPVKGEDERFTLRLNGVDPVTKFTDRPYRAATVMSPSALVSNWDAWFADSPPNAVLTFAKSAGKAPQSIVVTLSRPRWDKGNRTLLFTATRTYRTMDPSEKGSGWTRPETPRRFTSASLFIDDAGFNVDQLAELVESTMQQAIEPFVFNVDDAITWAAATSALSTALTQLWSQGALTGATPADAFTVACQPSTQQLTDAILSCTATMQLAGWGPFTLTVAQQETES